MYAWPSIIKSFLAIADSIAINSGQRQESTGHRVQGSRCRGRGSGARDQIWVIFCLLFTTIQTIILPVALGLMKKSDRSNIRDIRDYKGEFR